MKSRILGAVKKNSESTTVISYSQINKQLLPSKVTRNNNNTSIFSFGTLQSVLRLAEISISLMKGVQILDLVEDVEEGMEEDVEEDMEEDVEEDVDEQTIEEVEVEVVCTVLDEVGGVSSSRSGLETGFRVCNVSMLLYCSGEYLSKLLSSRLERLGADGASYR